MAAHPPRAWLLASHLCSLASALSVSSPSLTPDLRSGPDHGVRIAASPGKGMGAFATRSFHTRDTVGDYTGEALTLAQHDARYGDAAMSPDDEVWLRSREERGVSATGDYVVRVHDDLFIDAEDADVSSWCRFINHDSSPNLALKVLPKGIDGKPRVWFVCQRPVEIGDELCFDCAPRRTAPPPQAPPHTFPTAFNTDLNCWCADGPDFWDEELDGVRSAHDEPTQEQAASSTAPSPWYVEQQAERQKLAEASATAARAAVERATAMAAAEEEEEGEEEEAADSDGSFEAMEAALLRNLEASLLSDLRSAFGMASDEPPAVPADETTSTAAPRAATPAWGGPPRDPSDAAAAAKAAWLARQNFSTQWGPPS